MAVEVGRALPEMDRLVAEALEKVREWAADTRPTLSDPGPGKEWQVYISPIAPEDLDLKRNTLKLRYEWLLVDVP